MPTAVPGVTAGALVAESWGDAVAAAIAELQAAEQLGRLWIPATQFWPSTSNGATALQTAEYTGNKVNLRDMPFPNGATVYAETSVVLPSWNGGTFSATVYETHSSQFFNAVYGIQARSYGSQEQFDLAWGAQQTTNLSSDGATQFALHTNTTGLITPAGTPANGELVQLRVARGAIAGDDLAAISYLIGVRINYTRIV